MSEVDVKELANRRAGVDQMTRARELCGRSRELNAKLDAFLGTGPTRGQMIDFMEELKTVGLKAEMEANVLRICNSVGIEEPTRTEKLLAIQIGLLQEQNEALRRLASSNGRVAEQTKQQPAIFGPILMGMLLGRVL